MNPTVIANELAKIVGALTDIDQVDTDSYLPPVLTRTAALVIPPFGQQTRIDILTTGGSRFEPVQQSGTESHRIRLEIWVKLDTGKLPATIKRARELPTLAIKAILANPTLNNSVDRVGNYGGASNSTSIETETYDRPVTVDGVPYIVIQISVGVILYTKV